MTDAILLWASQASAALERVRVLEEALRAIADYDTFSEPYCVQIARATLNPRNATTGQE